MEGVDVVDRHRHRLLNVIAQAVTGVRDFLLAHLQRTDFGFVEFGAVFPQGIVATGFHIVQNLSHGTGNAFGGRDSRAHQQVALLFRATGVPVDNGVKGHGGYSIIFSIGNTRIELAPSAFSFSMVSQNRVSLLTICIATRC